MRGERAPARRLAALVLAVVAGLAMVGGTLSAAQAGGLFKYKTYKVPTNNSQPGSITVGSDGNLWFTQGASIFTPNPDPETGGTFHSNIGRITPGGEITEFRLNCDCPSSDIVQGPEGSLYFTSRGGLGRISTDGVVQPFIDAPFSVGGQDLDAREGTVWITDFNRRSLWRYDTASGGFTEFPIDGLLSGPSDLVVDSSGNVWFGASRASGGVIGRLNPTITDDPATPARENVTTFTVVGTPTAVSIATDGKVWFTDRIRDTVAYLDPANDNRLSPPFPTLTPDAGPQQITPAPGGSMWFTQANVGNAARITPEGVITEEGKAIGDDPDSGFENALGIAVRPDSDGPEGPEGLSVWFTMEAANKIAALRS